MLRRFNNNEISNLYNYLRVDEIKLFPDRLERKTDFMWYVDKLWRSGGIDFSRTATIQQFHCSFVELLGSSWINDDEEKMREFNNKLIKFCNKWDDENDPGFKLYIRDVITSFLKRNQHIPCESCNGTGIQTEKKKE